MTERVRLFVNTLGSRRKAQEILLGYPAPFVFECREETRSDAQNRLAWPLLDDISGQLTWHGRKLPSADWKNGLMIGLAGADFVPGINEGTVWPLGLSSSVLGKTEFSLFIDLIYAFGAEHGVTFRTDKARTLEKLARIA